MKLRALPSLLSLPLSAWVLMAACSSPSNPSSPVADGGVEEDGSVIPDDAGPITESCDPYEPRSQPMEVFIGPTGLETKIVSLIKTAEVSLSIFIYELDRPLIVNALIDAKSRGVDVRMIMDRGEVLRSNYAPPKAQLIKAGINVIDSSQSFTYMHAKSMVIDGKVAVIMSSNMNSYSTQGERNYGVVINDPDDVADLAALFEHDFTGAPLDLTCTRLVASNLNSRTLLLAFINRAKTKLDLSVMYLTDTQIVAAVKAKAAAGVTVRALLGDPTWMTGNPATAADLATAKIPVKYFEKYDLHAKMIMSDDAAFVGSENFSYTSLNNNREIGVFVTNDEPLAKIRTQFEADWAIGVAP